MSNIDLMVNQLRAVAAQAASAPVLKPENASGQDFASMLKSAIEEVNGAQMDARQMSRAFASENPEANLQDVVLSLQKASLSFQTMVQVRNKLVSAYQEVMSMQV